MIDYLVKKFIKNSENIEEASVRTQYGLLAAVIGILCNILLFSFKLLVGIMIKSISVMADAFNNLSDAASSIIGFIGVKMAEKPADEHHPFGHGRLEYIAAFIVAFIVIEVGFSLFKTSVDKIFHPEALKFNKISIGILCVSILVKLWMAYYNRKLGKKINSTVMMATSADSLGDVCTTSATIVSIVIFGIFQINIDGIVGTIVSVVVVIAGINIAKDTLAPLIGEAIDPEIYHKINHFVMNYDGIIGTHDLIVHNYGPAKSLASIHAEVSASQDIELSHEIIDRIEQDAKKMLGIELVIHMDPVTTDNEYIETMKNQLKEVLNNIDSRITFHDFRLVDGKQRKNLIFDIVIPREYSHAAKEKLKKNIEEKIKEVDQRCVCVITLEHSYCAEK